MADKLIWLTVNAFPGIDEATSDHLIQPKSYRGPAVMRRMLPIDPFVELGEFTVAAGFVQYDDEDASRGLHSHIEGSSNQFVSVNTDGDLRKLAGGTWGDITSDHMPFGGSGRIRFATGYGALFMVDGVGRPKVWGWDYDVADTTLDWDSQQEIAEIFYTYGQDSDPTVADDDFLASGVCFHATRLVLWKGNEVRLSAPYTPTVFYNATDELIAQAWFLVEDGTGLDVTAGWSFDNQMLIMALPHSLHGYIGADPASNYAHTIIDSAQGVYAPDSVALGGGKAWFCSYDGPCMMSMKSGVKYIGEAIKSVWDGLTFTQKEQTIGWWEDGIYYIVIPVAHSGVDGTIPDEAAAQYAYDPKTKRWAHMWGVSGIHTLVKPVGTDAYTLVHSDADGTDRLYKMNTGANLDGEDIISELVTPWLEFWQPWRDKWIREIRIELEQGPDTIEIEYSRDYEDTFDSIEVDAKPPDDVWTDASGGLTENMPRWHPPGHPDVIHWNAPGGYTIQVPVTIHCEAFKMRFRGKAMKVKSIGIGFMYEGT